MPQDVEVHVIGAYSGAPIPEPIDSSGNRAGRMNVDINSPDRPIALVLAAYDPVVWIVRKTKGTRLVGVWATGYHLPLVAGTGPEVPIVVNHYGQFNSCAAYGASQGSAHVLAKAGFNREATLYHDLTTIKTAQIGGPLRPGQAFEYAGPDYKALIDPNLEPGGEAGLRRREAAGEMRRATLADVHRWRAWIASCIPAPKMPPLARPAAPQAVYVPSDAWVVLRPTSYPPGLFGAHAAVFYIFEGVPAPTGDRGHSTVNDANQMACVPAPSEQGK